MIKLLFAVCCLAAAIMPLAHADTVRLKDLGRLEGSRENHLVGFGIVTGLAGTGDSSRSKATRQSIANMLSNFDVSITVDQINSRNVAIVSIMASLPPVARQGDHVDVAVTSLGDAKSLVGGTLLLAPLKAADGKIYALAQGAIAIGGYRYDQNGNVAQKNHPTVGTIPGGAQIEREILAPPLRKDGTLDFILASADYTTAQRVALNVNGHFRDLVASVVDSETIRLTIPETERASPSSFLATLEGIEVAPDTRAIVVVNERTGMIVAGGDVKISKVTVAHGDLKVSIATDYDVSQPAFLGRPGPGIRTEVVPNTRIDVSEDGGGVAEVAGNSSVADLIRALNRINANARDVVAILQGIKAAGALHADLIVQ